MTIKEEIRQIIEQTQRDAVIYVQPNNQDPKLIDSIEISNKIFKEFEKLIDEKIYEVQTTFYSSSRDTDYLKEKRKHQKQILEELKEELKK